MSNSKYNFKAGDTRPQITFRPAENQEFVSVPSGVSATFTVVDREAGVSLIDSQPATVEQTDPLVMSYTFDPGETDTVGDYLAEFELTFQDGGTRTFPDVEYIPISIHPELSAQGPVSVGPTRYDVTVGTLDATSIHTDELYTKTVAEYIHYARSYNGVNPDERLNNAVSAASNGHTIYLEDKNYTGIHTVDKELTIIGLSAPVSQYGTELKGGEIILNKRAKLIIPRNSGQITVNSDFSIITETLFTNAGNITVNGNQNMLSSIRGASNQGEVTFASGTAQNIIDGSTNVAVTDNGNNTIGDIA